MNLAVRRTYSQIDLEERRKIERWRHAGRSVDEIAERLGRHRSTIFRELKRNSYEDADMPSWCGYFCVLANDRALERRYNMSKLKRWPELCAMVVEKLRLGWSPEQICGRLKLELKLTRRQFRTVCHETIYRYVYSADGLQEGLWKLLPEHRRRRRPRHARRRHGRRFGPEVSILRRPGVIANRQQFGHWEGDLIQFRKKFGKANVTSLVERVSRFTVFLHNNDRQSRPVMEKLANVFLPLPFKARRSITFDRGTEFTDWPYLQAELGAQTWFCDPQSPWQKGTVENTNRRARKWLSRETDPLTLTDRDLVDICAKLNSTPRKCLGFKTPAEVFRQKVIAMNSQMR